jgi:conjugative transfer signal peptidase TraF
MSRRRDTASEAPLIRWAEQLRRDKDRRRKLVRRAGVIGLGLASLLTTIVLPPAPRLLWNVTASAPVGFYRVDPAIPVHVGDMAIANPPSAVRSLAALRHYLPLGVPLVKRIAAGPGDRICASGGRILINGLWVVSRRTRDARGRPMPGWHGCQILHEGQYLLLMPSVPTSFDGRYFGITSVNDIVGRATLLWRF